MLVAVAVARHAESLRLARVVLAVVVRVELLVGLVLEELTSRAVVAVVVAIIFHLISLEMAELEEAELLFFAMLVHLQHQRLLVRQHATKQVDLPITNMREMGVLLSNGSFCKVG
jgi:hypothetical protein